METNNWADQKARLFDRSRFVDDRGHFENIPLIVKDDNITFETKRVYLCDNFQKGTVRGYHYHRYEQKIFICLRGAVKFVLLPGRMFKADGDLWKPQIFILSADRNDALFIPANYANGWQSLTDNTILLGMSDRTMEQSRADDIRSDPTETHPEYWETKWR